MRVCVCVSVLYLQEVGREHPVSVSIIEGEGGGEARHGDALLDPGTDRPTPGVLEQEHTHTGE